MQKFIKDDKEFGELLYFLKFNFQMKPVEEQGELFYEVNFETESEYRQFVDTLATYLFSHLYIKTYKEIFREYGYTEDDIAKVVETKISEIDKFCHYTVLIAIALDICLQNCDLLNLRGFCKFNLVALEKELKEVLCWELDEDALDSSNELEEQEDPVINYEEYKDFVREIAKRKLRNNPIQSVHVFMEDNELHISDSITCDRMLGLPFLESSIGIMIEDKFQDAWELKLFLLYLIADIFLPQEVVIHSNVPSQVAKKIKFTLEDIPQVKTKRCLGCSLCRKK